MLSIDDYEAAVIHALECKVNEEQLQTWARAYQELSVALTAERAAHLKHKTSAALRGNGMDAVRGLIHGGKTFRIAQRLLHTYPAPPGPTIEIGAGWGPFGMAAAANGQEPVSLLEKSRRMLNLAEQAFEHANLKKPKTIIQDLTKPITYRNYSCFGVPFVLNEITANLDLEIAQETGLQWIRKWMRCLRPGGRLYLLEPGTIESAKVIQAIRNKIKEEYRILGPCTHLENCPMEDRPKDWCHFTLRIQSGALARRIAELASRRFQDVHFSWLVLENSKPQAISPLRHRILDIRRNDKKKLRMLSCSQSGHNQFVAQKRDKAVFTFIKQCQPGDLVELDLKDYEKKGDGFRLHENHCPVIKERLNPGEE